MDADQYDEILSLLRAIHSKLDSRPAAVGNSNNPMTRRVKEGVFEFSEDASPGKCRECEDTIFWHSTKAGKNIPLNRDGSCHFDTCHVRKDSQAFDNQHNSDEVPF